jgi:hypothetical protein
VFGLIEFFFFGLLFAVYMYSFMSIVLDVYICGYKFGTERVRSWVFVVNCRYVDVIGERVIY